MIKKLLIKACNIVSNVIGVKELYDLLLHREFSERQTAHSNPLNKSRFYGFAQSDEDGITLEILRRIGLKESFFVEFGVGNGLENNTAILLASGWTGAWFGGENIAFSLDNSTKLSYKKVWIKKSNIFDLYASASRDADVISLDLDGNDVYFVEELLKGGAEPKLFIVEYNGKFPPPIEFKIEYEDTHQWNHDDYFGASLASFNKLFNSYDYRLVCCNIGGTNAFFVHDSVASHFTDVPNDISDLYCEPFYFLRQRKMHKASTKTMELLIK